MNHWPCKRNCKGIQDDSIRIDTKFEVKLILSRKPIQQYSYLIFACTHNLSACRFFFRYGPIRPFLLLFWFFTLCNLGQFNRREEVDGLVQKNSVALKTFWNQTVATKMCLQELCRDVQCLAHPNLMCEQTTLIFIKCHRLCGTPP